MSDSITITGYKWNDVDGDGVWDAGETGLAGWTIYLDTDGVLNGNELIAVTDANGQYTFTFLVTTLDPYYVYEQNQAGWTPTWGGGGWTVTVFSDLSGSFGVAEALNFGNTSPQTYSISGKKYEDKTGNGITADDIGLGGFVIFVDDDGDGALDAGETSTVTAADGSWTISGLDADDVGKKVYEVQQDGYTQTVGEAGLTITNPGSGGTGTGYDFANFKDFSIAGKKYLDKTGDGITGDDVGLGGFTIFIDDDGDGALDAGELSTVTAADGTWTLTGLDLDDVGKKVYEVQQDGYTQTVGEAGLTITNPGSGGTGTGYNFANAEEKECDNFPEIKGISNIVLYFDSDKGDVKPKGGDGLYTVKIDNVPSSAPDDLDEWLDDVLDYLIANDPNVDANTDLLGVAVKFGFKTKFYADDCDPDYDPVPNGKFVTSSNIDKTYQYDVIF